MNRLLCSLLPLLPLATLAQPNPTAQRPTLTVESIMRDPKISVGTSPSSPFWSDDSRTIYFSWNPDRAKNDSLYKITLTNGRMLTPAKPQKVSPTERRGLRIDQSPIYNHARTQRVFESQGDLFWVDAKTGRVRQLTNTVDAETDPRFSSDETRVTFRRSGSNLFSINLTTGELTQLTDFRPGAKKSDAKPNDEEKFLKAEQLRLSEVVTERKVRKDEAERISKLDRPKRPKEIYLDDKQLVGQQISPDGLFVTYRSVRSASGAKTAQVPNYVTESGFTEDIPARTKVGAPQSTQEFFVYDVAKDTVRAISVKLLPGIADRPAYLADYPKTKADTAKKTRPVTFSNVVWSEDGKVAVVVIRSGDNKDRWITRLDPATLSLTVLDRQHDDAWIGGPGIGGSFSPGSMGFLADNHTLWFQSEADGYSHLYTVDALAPGQKKQLTSGKFEVQQAQLTNDKRSFFLQTNEVHPGEQHWYKMAVTGGPRTRLTTMAGANDVTISPEEQYMVVRHSSATQPWELYLSPLTTSAKSAATPTRLTDSQTDAFRGYAWREPTYVTIPARDNQPIYARLYKPAQPTGKAVVFVHGAGYLQNAHKWWSQYFREYMFHNLLVDKGYTVLDIDYRGSAGYGRDWRTGIYRHMGGKDLTDHVDAVQWLTKTQGVDAGKVGVYGGSYGGFITLMAMFTTPGVFKAGAALRPVTDWAAYNHPYTANILNEPQTDSLAYRRSSPINFAEGLKDNLLICHGMVDVNVHFQDAVRLSQRLIELKKENWELAPYPVEDHGFLEPTSWMDEYKRILKLFDERL